MLNKIKNLALTLSIAFFIFMNNFNNANADEIILINGDRITGTISKVEQGTLTLTTDYSEPMKIKKDKIKSIMTTGPVNVNLVSGEILKGILRANEDGSITVEATEARKATVINLEQITAINPSPVIQPKWKGNVTVGANMQSGNTKHINASISAEAVRKTEQDRFSIRFLHNYAEEEDEVTIRNTYGALKYDYFFIKSLYGYLGVELLNDTFRDLNLRTVVGPGIGYQIWDDQIKSLLFEIGVSYFSEDRKESEDNNWITGRLGSNFSYQIIESIVFSDQVIVYPGLEDIGEYQLRNEASLTSSLGAKWALKLTNILEHDSNPPEGVKKSDLYWILGLQYTF
jgi:putative salt-induced outer membrane protein YdiY/preprotein translocase subunit YajC